MVGELLVSFWCIAVPVVENGDDYFHASKSVVNACQIAVEECEAHYHTCEVRYCGEGDKGAFIECEEVRIQ